MLTHFVTILALNIVYFGATASRHDTTSPFAVESPDSAAFPAAPESSPLPRAPRAVKVTRTSAGTVLTWSRPASAAPKTITGYVVIVDDEPLVVSASTFRVIVRSTASAISIATMNDVGCGLGTPATTSNDARSMTIASCGIR